MSKLKKIHCFEIVKKLNAGKIKDIAPIAQWHKTYNIAWVLVSPSFEEEPLTFLF